ncbi:4-cresol dehydrogenase (hydroxylating) [Collimonas sp. OK607]|uniref:FAD-binding oxidoreductase n=1 Tax=Collimonas sp. OK607 TaxID=1798194 RepID=UPI0008EE0022|nr:FAD-binding oxidoreductase [Collimonas sp. OK607]SFB27728.1 4-cresol dehydrogenase (hydroxylating) [Collimonas sp. OK607]
MNEITVLPPNVSKAEFARAIAEYRKILGNHNVIVDMERLAPYKKIMVPNPEQQHAPAGALIAESVEQVQAVLAVCSKYRIPVWPISTGKNFGYGTAAPAVPGQMVLDLKRMNKILEFDPVLGTVLLEPGVTYQQLQTYIDERNLPFWIAGPGAGSLVGPVGQSLERGIGYTPYGDHFAHSCGMEVVLASGEVLRTGSGGITNTKAWQSHKYGYGPVLDGLFSQSNFGIVTKLGLWLMPAPATYKPFLVAFANHEDIGKAVEITQQLRLKGVIQNTAVIGHALYALAWFARRADIYTEPGSVTDEWLTNFLKPKRLPVWGVNAALYGSEERVAADWKTVIEAFKDSGGMLLTQEQLGGDPAWEHGKGLMAGRLDMVEYGLYNWRGGGGSAWFAPVMQARGFEALKTMRLGKSILAEYGFDFMGGYMVNPRDMTLVIDLLFDRSNPAELQKAHECFGRLIREFGAQGYGVYRTNIAFMEQVADIYGPVKKIVNQRIKRALDPKGIIAPGKSGIRI